MMKIIYYFKEKDVFMDKWQRQHIFNELSMKNITIEVFNPLSYISMDDANMKLLENLENTKYDMFMTPHNEKDLYIETLKKIKERKLPTLLICFDNLLVPFYHKKIAKFFDLVWLTSIETEEMFNKWGANTIFMPYAANPYLFKPKYTSEIRNLVFIGTPYGSRVNMINTLIRNDIRVDLFANIKKNQSKKKIYFRKEHCISILNLMRFKIGRRVLLASLYQRIISKPKLETDNKNLTVYEAIDPNQIANYYSNYALCLSSTSARNTGILKKQVDIINLRSFEIAMSGGVQICKYNEELASYFKENSEIIFYRSDQELIDKVKNYLKSENLDYRNQIKKNARKKAEEEHTWYLRFLEIFKRLNIDVKECNNE